MRATVSSFLAGLVGAGLGALAVMRWVPPGRPAGETLAPADTAGIEEMRADVREIRVLLDRPLERTVPRAPVDGLAGGSSGASASSSGVPLESANATAVVAPAVADAIEKAVAAGIAKARTTDPGAFAPPKPEPKKRATLAEAARELGLSAGQEDELRRAYSESTEKYLKLLAEPESTADALRRELEDAKADPAKKTAIFFRHMPKVLGRLGELSTVTSEREARIRKAVGDETVPKLRRYRIAEDDPFEMGDGPTFGVSSGD